MELLGYFVSALTPLNLLMALGGVVLGTVIGALPGLSATMAVAVLVPFTFTMDPATGLIALGAIYTGAIYGGAFAAILVNTPGTPSAIATTFDGFPMAKRGDGSLAVTLATLASVVGGLVGGVFLLLLSPPLAKVALAFGPPEYFWLAIFGLTLISALSVGNTLKGLLGGCIGLMLAMVGVAVVGGDIRFTMGTHTLLGGFDIVSALIGLYCIPVLIDLVATPDRHLKVEQGNRGIRLPEAFTLAWKSKFNVVRSAIVGTIVGILPGAGGSIAGLVSYSEARRSSKEPETFGKGAPDGLMATEAANNATVGGGFIPTLVLGIPGTPPDAIILGALLVQGIKIGPTLFSQQGDIVYTFIFGLLIATALMLPAGLLIGRYAYKSIASIPKTLLVPTIAFLTVIGSFAIHSNLHDVKMMLSLGVIGWILNRCGFAPSPIVLGLVLGKIAEQGFVQSYLIGNATNNITGMFFGRPISLAIVALAVFTLVYPLIFAKRKEKAQKRAIDAARTYAQSNGETTVTDVQEIKAPKFDPLAGIKKQIAKPRDLAGMVLSGLLILCAAWAFSETSNMTPMGSVFPGTISVAIIALSLALLLLNFARKPATANNADMATNVSVPRRIALVVVMAIWVFAIPVLGFATAAILAFLVLARIACYEIMGPKRLLIETLAAIAIVGGLYLLMADVLLIRMPAGLLF
ncbi:MULTISPECIES: tripartite tricarboxylate transporter permease [Thalassospira]|uniref:C4-dicarboxylate ABC transporter permease n=1 Tax=Thalassospira profundimaris TaxID=502049 RepID=A0A367VK52_9PROT|nr:MULTISPECIES: tripartite tricarboxylate transporter permease [Thalassospira]KZB70802.1 C4-dicarboxylate ABC transporter permease [Thalassospira sp. MCCC 1A01148]RCK25563.1 C4-dicarboxylate ABC transporter permease [Thalassospira profundimaris]